MDESRDDRTATTAGDDVPPQALPAPPPPPAWPGALHRAALAGFAGEVVGGLLPYTEADEAGLLLTLLAAVGNMTGHRAWWEVSGQRHGLRVWPVLVGATARGRKGTTWGTLSPVLAVAAPDWFRACVSTGLSTGEGLIAALSDPEEGKDGEAARERDKRLFLIEEEFGGTLAVANREGNTLSAVVRKAFDGGPLATLTRTAPLRAAGGHVTIVGHTSADELRANLRTMEIANGFANRFLFTCVRRSKLLPDGAALPPALVSRLASGLRDRLMMLPHDGRAFVRDRRAARLWREAYPLLTSEQTGIVGAVAARGEVHVMRLAAIYAVLDGRWVIEEADLDAAIGVWEYVLDSARWTFVTRSGDGVADLLLQALANGPLTSAQVFHLFHRKVSAARIETAVRSLIEAGVVVVERVKPASGVGRPAVVWRLGS